MKSMMRIATGFSLLLLAACGAPQQVQVEQVRDTSPAVVERVKSPEEIEEERVATLKAARQTAFDAYADKADEGRLKRAEAALRTAVELDAGDPNSWFNLGLVLAEQGDTTAASDAFSRAQALDAQFMRGKAYEGYIKLKEGDTAGAERVFRDCIASRENETGCNINLAILQRQKLLAAGKRDAKSAQEAIVFLRFALAGESLSADAYANLARIYFDLGRIELARVVCENAIQLGSDAATLHNRLGLIALAQKDVITAYREFLAAVKRDPDYVDAHMNIGAMALNFRDFEVAKRSFEAVLAKRENDRDARRSYGVALRGLDDGAGAEAQYSQLLAQDPNDFATL
jgi:tetratricopeptide (TPR) repeat protein